MELSVEQKSESVEGRGELLSERFFRALLDEFRRIIGIREGKHLVDHQILGDQQRFGGRFRPAGHCQKNLDGIAVSAEQPLLRGERGAQRRHRIGEPRLVERHNIEFLAKDRFALLFDRIQRLIEPEELCFFE